VTGFFQGNQNDHVEELQDQAIDGMVIEKDIEVRSTLSGSKKSSEDDDDIDADLDDEISSKSVKPERSKEVSMKLSLVTYS
jgi:hypothetical protein